MKQSFILLLLTVFFLACNSRKKEGNQAGDFFPVYSYLQSQIRHIDTSLYNLRKIEQWDSKKDTTVIPREQFRAAAADFLNIEDIASSKWRDDYTESRMYDDLLKRAIFSYTPNDEDAPILRQDVTIEPGAGGDGSVKTIFLNRLEERGDSSIQKKMLWEVGRRFQVVTTVSRNGSPGKSRVLEVWWAPFTMAE